jgi:hypothetical protein
MILMTDNLEKMWKESVVAYLKAVSQHSPGENDENNEKPYSG